MSHRQRVFLGFIALLCFLYVWGHYESRGLHSGANASLVYNTFGGAKPPLQSASTVAGSGAKSSISFSAATFVKTLQRAARNLPTNDTRIQPSALKQIAALETEKDRRTPAQQKMDSQLLYADCIQRGRPVAENVDRQRVELDYDGQGRVLVDIQARVTDGLLKEIQRLGGSVVSSFPQYNAVRAGMPLAAVEMLAAQDGVRFVAAAARPALNRVDSQGDTAHSANLARTMWGITGTNVSVGVLSDSVDKLTNSQIAGLVNVLPGQSGSPATGEGTAMLEIVNDLAPGAKLYFATASGGTANFAANIQQLRAAGCNIIVDDVYYQNESPFQDGLVAQAVNSVTAGGALYFSAAGDSGSKDLGWAGTWEGDFVDGGEALGFGLSGRVHSFGAQNFNVVQNGVGALRLDFFWSDPLGASTNDYDVFVLSSDGSTVVASATNPQNGTQDPYEYLSTLAIGELIVIVRHTGVARYLHLETGRGRLSISTSGNTHGHSCATNAFCVAAVAASDAGGGTNIFAGGSQDPVEFFSSDGPRRVFYQADGTPITPGNFSSTGGTVRQKPDIAAADGVNTDLSGFLFNPFNGTSAAAPHAAAIAALLESYNPTLTPSQIRSILTSTALDIEAARVDRDSGYGIVMAEAALEAAPVPPLVLQGATQGTNFVITFPTALNHSYVVERSTTLAANSWVTLTNFNAAGANSIAVDGVTNVPAFYRVRTTGN